MRNIRCHVCFRLFGGLRGLHGHQTRKHPNRVKKVVFNKTQVCSKCDTRKDRKYFSKNVWRTNRLNGWCKSCLRKIAIKCREHRNSQSRKIARALRLEVLQHYSKKRTPECACCKIQILEFLGIDHVKGGGRKHKETVKHLYAWLKKNRFPKGFRVLCHNCNQSLGAYGYCPHDSK
jgi:hypothetical protein